MPTPQRGLHESLLTAALDASLADLGTRLTADIHDLHQAEAADRIALHVGSLIRRALRDVGDKQRVAVGVRLAESLLGEILAAVDPQTVAGDGSAGAGSAGAGSAGDGPAGDGSAGGQGASGRRGRGAEDAGGLAAEQLVDPGRVLRAILAIQPDGKPERIATPAIPLLDTTLLTNAPGEPRVGKQIQTEIESADRIDVVMAFIRKSGLRPLLESLRRHCEAGRNLRVLTTTYTNSTEAAALDQLRDLGAQVRVSYDHTSTRLHAKAWLFQRASGFSTAYIGSSNLTFSAQVDGLEWNVRASAARNDDVIDKVAAVFESYWQGGDFVDYDRQQFLERAPKRDSGPAVMLSPVEIRPEPFQQRLLELIAVSRRQGHHRNLLVSATGTGKTVMAALDYARLRERLPRARLLFVAHRKEILQQSLGTFRHALREPSFGELWVGGTSPERYEHVFASIQSLSAAGLASLDADHFDVVIVDEFHHAAAKSYQALLDHIRPVELLGLTATPERSDGLPILHWFDDRIAAELRLWDAIDQHRLTPFLYYGVHDGLDLREIPWKRGRGYDAEALTGLLTANDAWAHLVLKQLRDHVDDLASARVLGFCVSIDHARFMARTFSAAGVASRAVWGDSSPDDRERALADLSAGRIRVLFSVDLFNEGVDLPRVDTLLFLRPTDSPTLFLQQLGRGLRRAEGKAACTVLDFVGQHRKEYRIDRRLGALLGGSRRDLIRQVEAGFPFLPAGCHMQLDPVASTIVLDGIKAAIPSGFVAKARELKLVAAAAEGGDVCMAEFLVECGLEPEDAYDSSARGWSDLRDEAGLPTAARGPEEPRLRRACARLLHLDDATRMAAYRRLLAEPTPPVEASLPERDRRLLRMLVASVVEQAVSAKDSLAAGVALLWQHPQVRQELLELLDVLEPRIAHAHAPLTDAGDCPLEVHARYTRRELLAGFGVGDGARVMSWQTGVYWCEEEQADLFAFTLDKTSGHFSPTTRYHDYAISPRLIHWESQSMTSASSPTGRRYQEHVARGSRVMLFARLRADDKAFWFLGPATYVSHESERPMRVTWRLEHELPGDLYASFAAAVA